MTNPYYECHITMLAPIERGVLRMLVEEVGWTFSAIDNDPVLGPGVKCYATKHYNLKFTPSQVETYLNEAVHRLMGEGAKVIREKIELVLVDRRWEFRA